MTIAAALMMCAAPLLAQSQAMPWIRTSYNPVLAGAASSGYASTASGPAFSALGNPALSSLAEEKVSAGASFNLIPSGDASRSVLAAGASARFGAFSIQVAYAGGKYPEVDFLSEGGSSSGSFRPSDLLAGAGFSFAASQYLSFGANVRYASEALTAKVTQTSINGDVAAFWRSDKVAVSAGVYCLGPKVKGSANKQYGLPSSAKLSAAWNLPMGDSALEVLADADYYFNSTLGLATGAHYSWKDKAFARVGFHYGSSSKTTIKAAPVPTQFAFGLGGKVAGAALDLALNIIPGAGTTLCAGVTYGF